MKGDRAWAKKGKSKTDGVSLDRVGYKPRLRD